MDADVEALARWMHETMLRKCQAQPATPYDEMGAESRQRYRAVAHALLTDPPDVLREALRADAPLIVTR
jgi:hypothetical protein